jgi:hypothetical protein
MSWIGVKAGEDAFITYLFSLFFFSRKRGQDSCSSMLSLTCVFLLTGRSERPRNQRNQAIFVFGSNILIHHFKKPLFYVPSPGLILNKRQDHPHCTDQANDTEQLIVNGIQNREVSFGPINIRNIRFTDHKFTNRSFLYIIALLFLYYLAAPDPLHSTPALYRVQGYHSA